MEISFQKLSVEKIIRERAKGSPIKREHYLEGYRPAEEEIEWTSMDISEQVESTISSISNTAYKDEEKVFFVVGLTSTCYPRKRTTEPLIKIFDSNVNTILERLDGEIVAYLNKRHDKLLIACPFNRLVDFNKSRKYEFKYFSEKVNRIGPLLLSEKISKRYVDDLSWIKDRKYVIIFIMPNLSNEKKLTYLKEIEKYLYDFKTECILFNEENAIISLLTLDDSKEVIKNFNYILSIEPAPEMVLETVSEISVDEIHEKVKSIPDYVIRDLPRVCLLDTGVSKVSTLEKIIIQRDGLPFFYDFEDGSGDKGHGTGIACLASLGENLDEPFSQIISYKILSTTRRNSAFRGIRQGLNRYSGQTRLFLSSINFDDNHPGVTKILDDRIQSLNVCFVNSAGNIRGSDILACHNGGLSYPSYFDQFPVKDPSQAISITSVGAISKISTNNSLAQENEIAPFSRVGSLNDHLYNCPKPEVVQSGGNFCNNGIYVGGLTSLKKDGSIFTNFCGTSYSAPLFMRRISQIETKYGGNITNSETLKAIAYASSTRIFDNNTGLGETDYFCECQPHQAVFFAEGTLRVPFTNRPGYRLFETDQISLKIPKSIRSIEIIIVHTDNFRRNVEPFLNTHFQIFATKTGNESGYTKAKNHEEQNRKSHVKCFKWQFERKSMEGDWTFHIRPDLTTEILEEHKEEITIRYGCAIVVTGKTTPLLGSLMDQFVND